MDWCHRSLLGFLSKGSNLDRVQDVILAQRSLVGLAMDVECGGVIPTPTRLEADCIVDEGGVQGSSIQHADYLA